ncbi:hypothetical protein B0J14DRAFT_496237, partial [Halenospora varia]
LNVVLTHGPPRTILDGCRSGNVGCESLLRAVSKARPRLCGFGHVHEAAGASIMECEQDKSLRGDDAIVRYKSQSNSYPETWGKAVKEGETLFVNAAIIDVENEPTNSPWVIELELEKVD